MIAKRSVFWVLIGMGVIVTSAIAKDAVQTPTDATSTNPLRSPYDAVHFFLDKVGDSQKDEAGFAEAMACFDLSGIDAEDRAIEGPEIAQQLNEILKALQQAGYFDPDNKEELPDEAEGTTWSFGHDPITLVLERQTRVEVEEGTDEEKEIREWKFGASIVEQIPAWHARLDELVAGMAKKNNVRLAHIDSAKLRSPYHAVAFFMETSRAALEDGDKYAVAMDSMDFSEMVIDAFMDENKIDDRAAAAEQLKKNGGAFRKELLEREGLVYVDDLRGIMQALIDEQPKLLASLPDEPDPEHKGSWAIKSENKDILVTLVRRGEAPGVWVFNPQTVKDIPRMTAMLKSSPAAASNGNGKSKSENGGAQQSTEEASMVKVSGSDIGETASPRQTLQTFMTAMQTGDIETAVSCLNLSSLDPKKRDMASILAGKLWLVMTREKKKLPEELLDDPNAPDQGPVLYRMEGRIEIRKQHFGDREGEWLFSKATVRDIERLYRAVEDEPIHESWRDSQHLVPFSVLPSLFVRERINSLIHDRKIVVVDAETGKETTQVVRGKLPKWLGKQAWSLQVWQWIGIGVVLLAGVIVRYLVIVFFPVLRLLFRTKGAMMLPHVFNKALIPCSTLAMVASWWLGAWLALDLGFAIMSWVWPILRLLMSLVGVVAAYRLVGIFCAYWEARASATETRTDDVLVPLVQKTSKVVVVAMGIVFIAKTLGFDIDPLIAGLGIGGLAFSFAAKDTIANFFGSVNVVLDRPFQVGEWVKIGDVEGVVESVGLRSSRIRTFYKSQVTIPNGEIMNAVVDNLGRRNLRRIKSMISVTYDTKPEVLEAFTEGVRELVRRHPHTDKDTFYCYVNQFATSSIDILLYCFLDVSDWGIELQERQRLFVDIIRLAESLGVEFAFLTRTLHMYNENANPTRMDHVPSEIDNALALGREKAQTICDEFLPKSEA